MRLTLRTMLAYMDEILEPSDREEISRKIEDSEFARNLMQRIQESIQKSRLGAPKVNAKGLGLDANTVAEYLDNTLSAERVPDFERVCLESEVHLAEVAACHQVLTMVLGRPAEIDPAMKRRMYKIAERISSDATTQPYEHGVPVHVADHAAVPSDTGKVRVAPPRHRPEVPAYLRERNVRSKWRSIAAALLLVVLLAGAINMALGWPLDGRNPVLRLLGLGSVPPAEVAKQDQESDHSIKQPDELSPNTETPSTESGGPAPEPTDASPTPTESATVPSTTPPMTETQPTASTGENRPVETIPPESTAKTETPPVLPSNPGAPSLPMPGERSPQPTPSSDNAGSPARSSPEARGSNPGATPQPADSTVGTNPTPAPESVPPEPMPPAADLSLGRFIPGKSVVLLRLDANSGHWERVPPGGPLAGGDKLLVLPTYRPTIALSSGLTLQLPSETMLELEAPDGSGIPGVKLYFGRLIAMTTGQAGSQLRMELGPANGVATFVDADATLAADVQRSHPFGVDPEKAEPVVAVNLYDVNGQLEWTSAAGEATKLVAAQRLPIVPHPTDSQPAGVAVEEKKRLPWIDREIFAPPSLGLASPPLADKLADEKRPLLQTLREFSEDQRYENRILGAECLAMLNHFDPLIDGLNDDRNRAYWVYLIISARNAMARDPATATKLREAYEQRRGQANGQQLYRMLGGFTNDQLTNGGWAAELVKYLDDDSLDFRVLAIANLAEITGKPLIYRPDEKTAAQRRPGVNRWKEELKAGRIVRKEPAPPKTP
ncbi:MAG: hypothetical protein IT427_09155 [Pirellulales bacterium]|nr:hypothetical protein [Pirellulales bacterium]